MERYVGLDCNEAIRSAIKEIAFHGVVAPKTGAIKNTEKITGYVTKFHDDPEDELFGTIDVQEYITDTEANAQAIEEGFKVGFHEGVYLSAIQNNESGIFIIPFLYSDVVIVTDPATLREYVVQYSHADKIQIDAHSQIQIGVTETKPYEETEDSPDYDELEPTKKKAHTIYTPTSALTIVASGDKPEEQSSINVKAESVEINRDKAQLILDAKQLLAKYNAKEIVIKEDGVYVGSGSAKEPAVLGNQLASLMVEWLGALSSMVTPTSIGPQAPANVAKFISLQAKIKSYQSAVSGILSKTVKIAE